MIVVNQKGEKQIVVRLGEKLDDIVEQMFLLAAENNSGNIRRTAKALGVCYRTALTYKKQFGIHDAEDETI